MKITFTNTFGIDLSLHLPQAADKVIPEWYKETESYVGGKKIPSGNGQTTATIKRCMPIFDSITAGYIISTYVDVFVSQKDGMPWYEWPSMSPIQFHPVEQASKHPGFNGAPYPKWINPWSIKTPTGYSCLFVQPFHRENKYFTILSGMVDTDSYSSPVNFPFVLNDVKFEGLIPAGTPLAQVIPIKRDSWKKEFGNEKDLEKQAKISHKLSNVFFDSYKTKFWHKKEYK